MMELSFSCNDTLHGEESRIQDDRCEGKGFSLVMTLCHAFAYTAACVLMLAHES